MGETVTSLKSQVLSFRLPGYFIDTRFRDSLPGHWKGRGGAVFPAGQRQSGRKIQYSLDPASKKRYINSNGNPGEYELRRSGISIAMAIPENMSFGEAAYQ